MSPLISGLLGTVFVSIVLWFVDRRPPRAAVREDGWRWLRAGWLLNGFLGLCVALTALFVSFFAIGGSARPDAATQNMLALGMLALAGGTACYVAWASYARVIRWRGDELVVRSRFGAERRIARSDIVAVSQSEAWGEYRLHFRDGTRLRLSKYLAGARELAAWAEDKANGLADYR